MVTRLTSAVPKLFVVIIASGSQANQILRQCPEAIRIFVGKSMVQMNVFAFDIAKIVEGFHQNAQINIFFVGATCVPKDANKRNFIR